MSTISASSFARWSSCPSPAGSNRNTSRSIRPMRTSLGATLDLRCDASADVRKCFVATGVDGFSEPVHAQQCGEFGERPERLFGRIFGSKTGWLNEAQEVPVRRPQQQALSPRFHRRVYPLVVVLRPSRCSPAGQVRILIHAGLHGIVRFNRRWLGRFWRSRRVRTVSNAGSPSVASMASSIAS